MLMFHHTFPPCLWSTSILFNFHQSSTMFMCHQSTTMLMVHQYLPRCLFLLQSFTIFLVHQYFRNSLPSRLYSITVVCHVVLPRFSDKFDLFYIAVFRRAYIPKRWFCFPLQETACFAVCMSQPILNITNEEVKARIGNTIGPYEDLLTTVKRRKLKWYGHVTRSSGLAKTILQGTVQGGRPRGRQRKRWEDNIKEWTGLQWNIALRKAENREEWRKLVVKSTVVPQRSARPRDR